MVDDLKASGQVLTAGGAGNPKGGGGKRKAKKNRKKASQKQQPTTPASKSTSTQNGAFHQNKENDDLLDFAQPPGVNNGDKRSLFNGNRSSLEYDQADLTANLAGNSSSGTASNQKGDLLSSLELEDSESQDDPIMVQLISSDDSNNSNDNDRSESQSFIGGSKNLDDNNTIDDDTEDDESKTQDVFWLFFCFLGIMASFVCYGLLLEFTTSGGRKLHELSFLFVTSSLYTVTAAFGRYVRGETPTTIPPARFAILGMTSMGSTFCSVRSLRYVIYPIQVLAKSCKPVPVMLFGALMGKSYPLRKYLNVCLIVLGVALFMGGGDDEKKSKKAAEALEDQDSSSRVIGVLLLFVSLCFDGGTGAYEDKLMSVHSVQPFDLMYNIQLGKTILAGIALLVLNQLHIFLQMCQEMGFLLVALGISGAMGQVFIFVTISKFGALTCSIIGLARKVTTLVASIYFYGHHLNGVQFSGLAVAVGAMVMNFMGKKKGGGGNGKDATPKPILPELEEEMQKMLNRPEGTWKDELVEEGHVELSSTALSSK